MMDTWVALLQCPFVCSEHPASHPHLSAIRRQQWRRLFRWCSLVSSALWCLETSCFLCWECRHQPSMSRSRTRNLPLVSLCGFGGAHKITCIIAAQSPASFSGTRHCSNCRVEALSCTDDYYCFARTSVISVALALPTTKVSRL